MAVTIEEVEIIARLAKLSFTEEEKQKFVDQFNQILQYMEKLNELDTSEIEPTSIVSDSQNVMRADEVRPWLSQKDALANAPRKSDGFFSVPRVIG
jgi:aspartyl-tRNA(Asn)/glutamyl-tRNA(Gln) amidotransferase subunit C